MFLMVHPPPATHFPNRLRVRSLCVFHPTVLAAGRCSSRSGGGQTGRSRRPPRARHWRPSKHRDMAGVEYPLVMPHALPLPFITATVTTAAPLITKLHRLSNNSPDRAPATSFCPLATDQPPPSHLPAISRRHPSGIPVTFQRHASGGPTTSSHVPPPSGNPLATSSYAPTDLRSDLATSDYARTDPIRSDVPPLANTQLKPSEPVELPVPLAFSSTRHYPLYRPTAAFLVG